MRGHLNVGLPRLEQGVSMIHDECVLGGALLSMGWIAHDDSAQRGLVPAGRAPIPETSDPYDAVAAELPSRSSIGT
jgi:hypothetical protein